MFSSPAASQTNRSLRPRPSHSNRCHPERSEGSAFLFPPIRALSVSAFSSPDVRSFNFQLSTARPDRSEGSCLVRPLAPIAPFEQSLLCRRPFLLAVGCELSTDNCHPVSPFPATLTDDSQLTENSATLSPVPATLTSRVNPNPFVCHSCRKHPGWGYLLQAKIFSFGNLTTNYSPLSTISFIIRTSAKHTRNTSRIRTSKTQDLKPFRMNTYKKTGEGAQGVPRPLPKLVIPRAPRDLLFAVRRQLASHHSLLTTHYSLLTSAHLKPVRGTAHLYLCTCKKGPAAREPRYSLCAAS
jgi:hypothetical protein